MSGTHLLGAVVDDLNQLLRDHVDAGERGLLHTLNLDAHNRLKGQIGREETGSWWRMEEREWVRVCEKFADRTLSFKGICSGQSDQKAVPT